MIALVSQDSLLVMLVKLQNRLPMSLSPAVTRTRASDHVPRPPVFIKAGVLMIVRHLHAVHELRSRLAQPAD